MGRPSMAETISGGTTGAPASPVRFGSSESAFERSTRSSAVTSNGATDAGDRMAHLASVDAREGVRLGRKRSRLLLHADLVEPLPRALVAPGEERVGPREVEAGDRGAGGGLA